MVGALAVWVVNGFSLGIVESVGASLAGIVSKVVFG